MNVQECWTGAGWWHLVGKDKVRLSSFSWVQSDKKWMNWSKPWRNDFPIQTNSTRWNNYRRIKSQFDQKLHSQRVQKLDKKLNHKIYKTNCGHRKKARQKKRLQFPFNYLTKMDLRHSSFRRTPSSSSSPYSTSSYSRGSNRLSKFTFSWAVLFWRQ